MRIRIIEPKTDGSRAARDVDDARRLGRFLQQLCECCDGDGGSNGIGSQRRTELFSGGFAAGRVRNGVFVFAGDGGVVDEGVEAVAVYMSMGVV
jgi:hypothetical protein